MPQKPYQLGTDLVFIPRVEKALLRYGVAFANKILMPEELAYFEKLPKRKQAAHLAGRIAFKEATIKATGLGLNAMGFNQGLHWKDIGLVAKDQQSRPELCLSQKAKKLVSPNFINCFECSISHDGDYAIATVIFAT